MSSSAAQGWGPAARAEITEAELGLIRAIALSLNREIVRVVSDGGIFDDRGQPLVTFAPGTSRDKGKCIIAGAGGRRVFPRFGFEAEPRTFEAVAMNEQSRQGIASMEDFRSAAGYRHFAERTAPNGLWSGHMALMVRGMIVDPLAGQFTFIQKRLPSGEFSGPREHEFHFPDTVIISAADIPADNLTHFAEFHGEDGGVLGYRHQPNNTGYQQFGYWTHAGLSEEIANRVEADVRAEQQAGRAPVVQVSAGGIVVPDVVRGRQNPPSPRRI